MSDTMLLGVLRMPFDLAMSMLTSRIQYHRRGVQAADEIEQLTRERDEARAEIEKLRAENDEKQALIDAASQCRNDLQAHIDKTYALLKDSNVVAVNLLRGVIALPSVDQIRHIYQQTPEAKP